MKREYHPLSAHRLESGARYHQPGQDPERVRIDSPALAVMTDLRQIPAATISGGAAGCRQPFHDPARRTPAAGNRR